jgi:uncharacterized damage-inducible protein DinB
MTHRLERAFLEFSCAKLEQLTERTCECLDRLDNEQIWFRATDSENAVGNLILHLCGNVRQWIGFGVGNMPDVRHRDLEFSARGGAEAGELRERLRGTVTEAIAILRALEPGRLLETRKIQTYEVPVMQAIYHVVEHFSGHVAQIQFATKQFTGRDLGFYSHLRSRQPPRDGTP